MPYLWASQMCLTGHGVQQDAGYHCLSFNEAFVFNLLVVLSLVDSEQPAKELVCAAKYAFGLGLGLFL